MERLRAGRPGVKEFAPKINDLMIRNRELRLVHKELQDYGQKIAPSDYDFYAKWNVELELLHNMDLITKYFQQMGIGISQEPSW